RPGVDLRGVVELHPVDCAPTDRSGHVKDHRGRSRLHANRRRTGWPRSITEAIPEPGVDVPDDLIQIYIEISIRHDPVLAVRLDHNPLQESRARSCTGSSGVGG